MIMFRVYNIALDTPDGLESDAIAEFDSASDAWDYCAKHDPYGNLSVVTEEE